MNFLWDIVLRAEEQGQQEEQLFFRQAEEYSPFFEQSFSCINEKEVSGSTVELNLLYRFADIFQNILFPEGMELDEHEYEEFRLHFIDAALHTLLFTDLRNGLTKRELYVRKIREELINGIFWRAATSNFCEIDHHRQGRLATLLLTQMETGSSLIVFRRAVLVLYPDAMLYQIKSEKKRLLLYLKDKKDEIGEKKIQFVKDMFLPIGFELRVFWEYHFGIIGIDETMKLDEMAIY